MNTLNLTRKIDEKSIAIYSAIDRAARELKIPYIVIGASARDLVLHYGYGARIRRATEDIDFGIQLPDWDTYRALTCKLSDSGFSETVSRHRLIHGGIKVDLVPFGEIQNQEAMIAWPPDQEFVMNVMGFREALTDSVNIVIQDDPRVMIPVVKPPGLSLLKIISWSDRDSDLKQKDARDFVYLLKSYESIPEIRESIFDNPDVMESLDWNIELGSAFKLGLDSAILVSEQTRRYLKKIETSQIQMRSVEQLVEDMCDNIEEEFENNLRLLQVYFEGINHTKRD